MQHQNYESIDDVPGWEDRLGVCSTCGELVYAYPAKTGGFKITDLFSGWAVRRTGMYNNFVADHECGIIRRRKMFLVHVDVPDEIDAAVDATEADGLQKHALKKVLAEFGTAKRSGFKKSLYAQATAYLNGESRYRNPFSPKQLLHLIETKTYDREER